MVPAPRTATRRSGVMNARVSQQGLDLQDLFDNQAIALNPAAQRDLRLEGATRAVQHRAPRGSRLNTLNRHRVSAFVEVQQASVARQQRKTSSRPAYSARPVGLARHDVR